MGNQIYILTMSIQRIELPILSVVNFDSNFNFTVNYFNADPVYIVSLHQEIKVSFSRATEEFMKEYFN